MNLNLLKAFVEVVQTGSFKEAARRLSVSQPAITQRIQSLEDYLKTKLISKGSEGIHLTCHGKTLYDRSLGILALWDELQEEIWGTKVAGKLVVGASTIPSEYILPRILKAYRNKYPEIRLQLKISGTKEVIKWLQDRTLDVAITGEPQVMEDIHFFPISDDTMKIIVPIEWKEQRRVFSLAELMKMDWVMREPESDTRRTFESHLMSNGYSLEKLNVSSHFESTEAVIAAVEAGLGISVVSSLAAERGEKLGRIRILEIPDFVIQRKFYCSYRVDQHNQSVLSTFLRFMEQNNEIKGLTI
jgi:DNA-binding transcriptional LysR family regulator